MAESLPDDRNRKYCLVADGLSGDKYSSTAKWRIAYVMINTKYYLVAESLPDDKNRKYYLVADGLSNGKYRKSRYCLVADSLSDDKYRSTAYDG